MEKNNQNSNDLLNELYKQSQLDKKINERLLSLNQKQLKEVIKEFREKEDNKGKETKESN